MSEKKFIKKYTGSSSREIPWSIFVEIFNEIWGQNLQTFLGFSVVGGIYGKWYDADGNENTSDNLAEIEEVYIKDGISRFSIMSLLGETPEAILIYNKDERGINFEIKSKDELKPNQALKIIKKYFPIEGVSIIAISQEPYVKLSRLNELRQIHNPNFDTTKLIRLCEELNIVFSYNCYFSTAMLIRSIVDHIPPVFGKVNFEGVMAQYGDISFKNSMKNLNNSLKNIADRYLHSHIRKKEALPNSNQVVFKPDLDVLLEEVVTVLKPD